MKKYLLLTIVASMCQVDVILGCWADNGNGRFWSWNCWDGIGWEGKILRDEARGGGIWKPARDVWAGRA